MWLLELPLSTPHFTPCKADFSSILDPVIATWKIRFLIWRLKVESFHDIRNRFQEHYEVNRFSGSHALQQKTNTHRRPFSLYLPSKKFKTVLANHKLTASREAYHFWILELKTSSSEDVTYSLRFTAARMTLSNGQTRSHKDAEAPKQNIWLDPSKDISMP